MSAVAAMKPGTSTVQIQTATGNATCPGQKLRVDNKTGQITAQDTPPVNIPLSAIRMNDIFLAGVGGDVSSDIGVAFKVRSPYP
jgi:hypothetical protein